MEKKKTIPSIWASPHRKAELAKAALPKCWLPYYITRRTSPLPSWIATVRRNLSTNSAERDRDLIESSPELGKELHERLSHYGKKSYHIIRSKPERAVSDVMKYFRKMKTAPQLIIFDFPGHALTSAMMDLSITMDYIISPIEADPQSLASSFAYAKTSGTLV